MQSSAAGDAELCRGCAAAPDVSHCHLQSPSLCPMGGVPFTGAIYHPTGSRRAAAFSARPAATGALCSSLSDNTDADVFRVFVVRTWNSAFSYQELGSVLVGPFFIIFQLT